LQIFDTYLTVIDFTIHGTPYTFTITKWQSKLLRGFLERFHAYTPRDEVQFGHMEVDEEGNTNLVMNLDQKINTVVQASKDVLGCLDKISNYYKRSVLDYAVWYREKYPVMEERYNQLITKLTCHLIVHTDFLAPNLHWDVVEFL